jgi:hypothetical protein
MGCGKYTESIRCPHGARRRLQSLRARRQRLGEALSQLKPLNTAFSVRFAAPSIADWTSPLGRGPPITWRDGVLGRCPPDRRRRQQPFMSGAGRPTAAVGDRKLLDCSTRRTSRCQYWEHCPNCGGQLKIIAAIIDGAGDREHPHTSGPGPPGSAAFTRAHAVAVAGGLNCADRSAIGADRLPGLQWPAVRELGSARPVAPIPTSPGACSRTGSTIGGSSLNAAIRTTIGLPSTSCRAAWPLSAATFGWATSVARPKRAFEFPIPFGLEPPAERRVGHCRHVNARVRRPESARDQLPARRRVPKVNSTATRQRAVAAQP